MFNVSQFHPCRFPVCALAAGLLMPGSFAAAAPLSLIDAFTTNPLNTRARVSGDSTRFDWSPGQLVAHYNSTSPTAKLLYGLGGILNQNTAFNYSATFSIASKDFYADPQQFSELSFGLVNSLTTGNDRNGGNGGDAFDIATVDYFPNVSPTFGGPSLGPTVISTQDSKGFFGDIYFPFGPASTFTGHPLPLDTPLTATVAYDPVSRDMQLHVTDAGGLNDTVDNVLPVGTQFSTDAFGLTLWQDTFNLNANPPSVAADVAFSSISVTASNTVPEPATLDAVAAGFGLAFFRRRRGIRA